MNCPICGTPTTWQDDPRGPFCSERCKLLDFGNWIDEGYRVPQQEGPAEQFDRVDEQSSPEDNRTGSH